MTTTTTTPELNFDGAAQALRAPRVVCAVHMEPDADALGSALALTHAVRALGGEAVTAIGARSEPEGVPARLRALPGAGELVSTDVEPAPEVLAVLDCATPERLGGLAPLVEQAGTVVWIDHHQHGTPRGAVQVVDPTAAATAELAAEIVRRLGVPLTGDVATCCFAGLATDTGRFSNGATRGSTLRLAAELADGGVDVPGLSRALFESFALEELRVLGRVLAAARHERGGLVWSTVAETELAASGLALGDTDRAVELMRGVTGARCALLLKQRADGGLKGSLRGVGDVDVAAIARQLGGGGHAGAAGFDTDTDTDPADVVAWMAAILDSEPSEG